MTHDADLKRLVRARMATTGENYTTARAALPPERRSPLQVTRPTGPLQRRRGRSSSSC